MFSLKEAALERLTIPLVLLRYFKTFGRLPNLIRPAGFNDHITHRLVFDRDPLLKIVCDKIEVKSFIARRVGQERVVPLIGAWMSARAIPWDELPGAFVLKPSFSSGPFEIVGPGTDRQDLALRADGWLTGPQPLRHFCEWGHRGLPKRLMAEPLLVGPKGQLVEWNVFVFGGKAKLLRALMGRKKTEERRDAWFDRDGRQLDIRTLTVRSLRYELDASLRAELIRLAEDVATGFVSMRVDLLETDRGILVGELSPYSWGGHLKWPDPRHDRLLGSLFQAGADTRGFADFTQ